MTTIAPMVARVAGSDVAVTADGYAYVVGGTGRLWLGKRRQAEERPAVLNGGYDSTSNEVWTRQYGSTGAVVSTGLALDGVGDMIVVGGIGQGDSLQGHTSAGATDVFIRKNQRVSVDGRRASDCFACQPLETSPQDGDLATASSQHLERFPANSAGEREA